MSNSFQKRYKYFGTKNLRAPENITLFAVDTNREGAPVVGFSFGVPVTARPDVSRQLRGLLPIRNTSISQNWVLFLHIEERVWAIVDQSI